MIYHRDTENTEKKKQEEAEVSETIRQLALVPSLLFSTAFDKHLTF